MTALQQLKTVQGSACHAWWLFFARHAVRLYPTSPASADLLMTFAYLERFARAIRIP